MLFIQELTNGRIVQALCWTLLHSLWQGLLLAIVGGAVILLTRKSAPAIRYNLLSALFFLFFLGAVLTFGLQWHSAGAVVNTGAGALVSSPVYSSPGVVAALPVTSDVSSGSPFMNALVNYFDAHAMLVVMIWFIIFSARLVRILAHLSTIQRMRHYRTHQPSGYWKSRLQELALALEMRIGVSLLESEIVRVPMVVGFFKPMILVPFSLLSQLPPEQVEAILLHELAHIRRRDYFVNLIQHFTETLFFFNPGVLWISSLIREERENCCDDIAVGQVKSKKEFIHALVSFQEYNNAGVGSAGGRRPGTGLRSALAFAGSRDHLLQRVKRIVYRDNKILDIRERFFLLGCLLITCTLTFAFSYSQQQVKLKTTVMSRMADGGGGGGHKFQRTYIASDTTRPDTRPDAKQDTRKDAAKQGTRQEALITDSVPNAARREELRREREMLAEQQQKLSEELRSLSEQQEKLLVEEMRLSGKDVTLSQQEWAMAAQGKLAELGVMELKRKLMIERTLMDEDRRGMSKKEKVMMEKNMRDMEENQKAIMQDQKVMTADQLAMLQDQKVMTEDMNRKMEAAKLAMLQEKLKLIEQYHRNMEAEANQKMMEENKARMEIDREHMLIEREKRSWEMNEKMRAVLDPVIEFLSDNKLITDRKKDFSFSLDKYGLTVNGVKQPDALYQQFREKFLKNEEEKIVYSRKNGSESVTINKE